MRTPFDVDLLPQHCKRFAGIHFDSVLPNGLTERWRRLAAAVDAPALRPTQGASPAFQQTAIAGRCAGKSNAAPGRQLRTARADMPGWWEALWPNPDGVLAKVGLEPGMVVADLCCGDGWFSLAIARIAKFAYGIDLDVALLEAARAHLGEVYTRNCKFIAGDAFDFAKLLPEQVDYVFLANVFHGVPDRPRLARAVRDKLTGAGLFVVINWHARHREETTVLGEPRGPATKLRMTPEATIEAVEPSGFKLTKLVDVSPYHYGAVFRRS
jgi:SAM-dependent methyltransferase